MSIRNQCLYVVVNRLYRICVSVCTDRSFVCTDHSCVCMYGSLMCLYAQIAHVCRYVGLSMYGPLICLYVRIIRLCLYVLIVHVFSVCTDRSCMPVCKDRSFVCM